jgi:soluble lytic murein transglycosylase
VKHSSGRLTASAQASASPPELQRRRKAAPTTFRKAAPTILRAIFLAGLALAAILPIAPAAQTPAVVEVQPLTATAHAPIPRDPFQLWLAPIEPGRRTAPALTRFRNGVRLHGEARYHEALPLVSAPLTDSPLADYATYYTALTQLRLSQLDAAHTTFSKLLERPLKGYLAHGARFHAAETAEARGDYRRAAAMYKQLAAERGLNSPELLMRYARSADASGDTSAAATAWARVYYEFALSPEAPLAAQELDARDRWQELSAGSVRYTFELGRAERLFGAKRYADARPAFATLQPLASGDEKELIDLRIAECDHYMQRYGSARAALEPYTRKASRQAEAQFFYLTATRELGDHEEYVRRSRELVRDWPNESWAEETLNNLGTHYIKTNEDEVAAGVFAELLTRFPDSRHAPRAAWKSGWWAYRNGRYDETARVFESAAARFPRSDYRSAWLYWTARSYDRLDKRQLANARYALVLTDYSNSYYGRLAARILTDRDVPLVRTPREHAALKGEGAPPPGAPALPPTEGLIRALIAHEMYDDAMRELQYAQQVWGDSPAIQATMGLVYAKQGDLRRGINAVKRAYPQYIAAGGEQLPDDLLRVLFPVAYWDLIRQHSKARDLDPYLIAALMAQESTFDPQIRSVKDAVGLMQVLPSTGRRYARKLGIRRFSAGMLTNPETNIRLGTAIFADLTKRYGGTHFALASYNAGETALSRWISERPGLERDEFIDDIPYPETQNYVKKIVGTAEDYRRLYGGSTPASTEAISEGSGDTRQKVSARPKPSRKAPARKSGRSKRAR